MAKWQPIMLILDEGENRLECECGALAIFVSLFSPEEETTKEGKRDMSYKSYCQSCFEKAQEEEEEGEYDD